MTKRFITLDELSIYLSLSKNTIYSWVNQGKIPYHKVSRLLRFDLIKIDEWMKEKGIPMSDKIM
jgi:excisionase family DNA binding protein